MVFGIYHPPRHIAVDPDILQRRRSNLPPPRNKEPATGRCVHTRPSEVFLGPSPPSHVPIFALVGAVYCP